MLDKDPLATMTNVKEEQQFEDRRKERITSSCKSKKIY